jgi:hypothetical protein
LLTSVLESLSLAERSFCPRKALKGGASITLTHTGCTFDVVHAAKIKLREAARLEQSALALRHILKDTGVQVLDLFSKAAERSKLCCFTPESVLALRSICTHVELVCFELLVHTNGSSQCVHHP